MTFRSHGFLEFLWSSSNFLIDRELLLFLVNSDINKYFGKIVSKNIFFELLIIYILS
jgi:hypothetical protein